ncbi:MAG: hypothetical protein H7210_06825 [Pyrinomonadaceae bacterium]|nr:hypothetical protein [Phycisphaerales bacterium]
MAAVWRFPVARTRSESTNPIDALMEEASRSLVHRHYFDAERHCMDALRMAFASQDFERMARIVLPLEEARRQKRDLAYDAGNITVVGDEIPAGKKLVPGCYLICPPRVGLDGRLLREEADKKKVPTIIVTREPTTREGLWPIVALGPVTVRLKVPPPIDIHAGHRKSSQVASFAEHAPHPEKELSGKSPKPPRIPAGKKAVTPPVVPEIHGLNEASAPTREWFLHACEALGDAAIASADPGMDPLMRVDALLKRLEAHPDHEKLHQVLGEACRDAVIEVARAAQTRRPGNGPVRANVPEDMDDFDL